MERKNTFSPGHGSSQYDSVKKEHLPSGSRIAVIGAGAFGGWAALYLQRSGYKVTLVDQWGPGNSRASSGGETRLIRCIYGINPFYTALANRAYDLWIENEPALGGKFLYPKGCLWFSDQSADDLVRQALPIIEKEGLQYQCLSPEELSKYFPQIKADDCEVILEKKTGYLLARAASDAVKNLFVKEGGTYVHSPASLGEIKQGLLDAIRLGNSTELRADGFLFACGPWLREMFPEILASQLTITRQEVYYFGIPSKISAWYEELPTWIDHSPPDYYYGIPGGIRRGFKIAFDRRGSEVDPTSQNRSPSKDEVEKARDYIGNRFVGLEDLPLIESRVCQYADTSDGNFIFDQHPEASNLWLLGGGSGHGYKHGPSLGELVSDSLSGKRSIPGDLRLNRDN